MILELRNICKTYTQGKLDVPVLKNVSLSVEEGEYLAIMGPSGSGKTTLMNLIGCLDTPTSGEYYLEGQDLSGESDLELSRVRLHSIGFVFQSFHLLPRQSALENVALPLQYAGVRKKERLERARQALERVGLEDRVDFKPTQLSGGQCQRVAIARAIVNNPKILLADEPTGALDTASGEQIMEVFQRLNNEGVTIVMITHEPQIAAHARRVLHIRDGQLTDEKHVQSIVPAKAVDADLEELLPEEAVEETPAAVNAAAAPLPVRAKVVPPLSSREIVSEEAPNATLPNETAEKAGKTEKITETAPEVVPAEEQQDTMRSADTFLDTEISALLDKDDTDTGKDFLKKAGIPTEKPAKKSTKKQTKKQAKPVEELPEEESPALVDRPTKSGAPAQISFDIWAKPEGEFDTAAAEFAEEAQETPSPTEPVAKAEQPAEPAKKARKKSAQLVEIENIAVDFEKDESEAVEAATPPAPAQEAKPAEKPAKKSQAKKKSTLIEIEDINVGFEKDEPEAVEAATPPAPAQEAKPAEKPEKKSSAKKKSTLIEIEDINVGFEKDEPEAVEAAMPSAPAQEAKPAEKPAKKSQPKKKSTLIEIEDINVGFEKDEPEAVEAATPPAPVQEAKPAEKPAKKSQPKKKSTLIEIEDINVGFEKDGPEATASVQEAKPAEKPAKKSQPKKKSTLIEIEDINVEFDSDE